MATGDDHIQGIRGDGRSDAIVDSEGDARRIIDRALPEAVELPPAIAGRPYPGPPSGVIKWFQRHPPDAVPGSNDPNLPHLKYVDWSRGKKNRGGSWGHLFFPEEE